MEQGLVEHGFEPHGLHGFTFFWTLHGLQGFELHGLQGFEPASAENEYIVSPISNGTARNMFTDFLI